MDISLSNAPPPGEVQIPPPAFVMEPDNATWPIFAQISWPTPTAAIGCGLIVKANVSDIESQPPTEVKYKSTVPLLISPEENV